MNEGYRLMMFLRWTTFLSWLLMSTGLHVIRVQYEGRECYVDIEENPYKCYVLPPETASWENAGDQCKGMGARLAYTKDPLSLKIIQWAMKSEGWVAAWLGASKERINWKWTSEPIEGIGEYSAWGVGSPASGITGQDCAMMVPRHNFVWLDRPCSYSAGYICETETTNPLCEEALVTDEEVLTAEGRCYIFSFSPHNWFMARQVCSERGGRLAKLDSAAHYRIAVALPGLGSDLYGFWIGLSSVRWVWIDGSEVNQTFWEASKPGLRGHCLLLEKFDTDQFFWSDSMCESNRNFVCEYDINPINLPTPTTRTPQPSSSTAYSLPTTTTTTTRSTTTSRTTTTTLPTTRRTTTSTETTTASPTTTTTKTTTTTTRPTTTTTTTSRTTTKSTKLTTLPTTTTTQIPTASPTPVPTKSTTTPAPVPSSPPQTPVPESIIPPGQDKLCVPVDLTFMVDSSSYVSAEEFRDILSFIKTVQEIYSQSDACMKTSIVSFGESASLTMIPIGAGEEVVSDIIDNVPSHTGERNIAGALEMTLDKVYNRYVDRQGVHDLMFIITKGQQTFAYDIDVRIRATMVRHMDIVISVIHVGYMESSAYAADISSQPHDTFNAHEENTASLMQVLGFTRNIIEGIAFGEIQTLSPFLPAVPTLVISSSSSPSPTIQPAAGAGKPTVLLASVVTVITLMIIIGIVICLVALALRRKRNADETAIIGRDTSNRLSSRSIKSTGSISPNSSISTPWGTKKNSLRGIAPASFGRSRSAPRAGLTNPESNNLFYNSWIIPSDSRR